MCMEFEKLTALLDRLPRDVGVPGCECMVYLHGEPMYRHTAGVRDVETGEPVRPGDRYYLYSVSKLATCTAVLQRLEAGDFLLTDPVGEYLPAFKEMTVRVRETDGTEHMEKAKNPVTILHLLTMTAGLDYDFNAPAVAAVRQQMGEKVTTRQVAAAIAAKPLSFEPGTHWQYSLCHDVLGALVEEVSGERFAQYVQRHIFAPCGMENTLYHGVPGEELAPQYRFDDALGRVVPEGQTNSHILGLCYDSGGAGVISTVPDYIRFADALCHFGMAGTGEQILSPRTVELMRTNALDETCRRDMNWSQLCGYGYGLGVRTMVDPAAGGSLSPVGEFGWGGAAGAYALIDPSHELTLFYVQHMLNNKEPYIHPRLRNALYADLGVR